LVEPGRKSNFIRLRYRAFALRVKKTKFASLKGKTIWVTGASSGIGAELVCKLVEAEAGHVILSSRQREKLHEVAQDCGERSTGSSTILSVLSYDAASINTTEETVARAMELVGKPIDMLFLNSGIYQLKPALQTTIDETRKIMRVNFEAPVELAQTLIHLDTWKERGYGHIVVTASIMSRGAHSLSSTYSASKHALRGYFQSLSTEEFRWLRVDVVCPGAVATNMWNALDKELVSDEGAKLRVDRFVRLMLTGVVGPQVLFYETWISNAPGLMWITLSSYTPHLFHLSIHVLGVARLIIWEKGGEVVDALNLPEILWALWKTVIV